MTCLGGFVPRLTTFKLRAVLLDRDGHIRFALEFLERVVNNMVFDPLRIGSNVADTLVAPGRLLCSQPTNGTS